MAKGKPISREDKQALVELVTQEIEDFIKDYKKVLAFNYRNSRQADVDNSEYNGTDLTLATNIQELYDFISRYSDILPSFNNFQTDFRKTVKYVKGFKVQRQEEKEAA